MGLDIYSVFQRKEADGWVDIASDYTGDRDYELYSWLGVGAGDRIGTCSFESLIPLRGFPDDFEVVEDRYHPTIIHGKNESAYHPNCILMGEWGYSWIFASEILQASAPRVTRTVVIPIDKYCQWDGISEPAPWEWASNSFGHAVGIPDKLTHIAENVTAEWNYDFTEDFSYFVDEVRRLKALHGNVRFVFGFA